ncbi:MAG: gliding motility-associated C-terminal domain-containing protein [Bacteroidota bacterium]
MSIPSCIRWLFLLLFLLSLQQLTAQEIVLSTLDNRLYSFDPADCTFEQIGFMPESSTDISFHPNGNFYALNGGGSLFEIDIVSGSSTLLHTFENGATQLYTALTISAEGIFYACGLNGDLWSYDLVTDQGTFLGDVGFGAEGDLTFFAGELYMAAQDDNIVRVNLDNPANSSVVIDANVTGRIFGIVSFVESCEDVTVYALTNNSASIYEVNFQETSLDFFCTIPLQVSGGASTFEFLGSNPVFIDEVFASNFDCNATTGEIALLASGGVGQLTYSIDGENFQDSPIFLNLPLTDYTVYVSDENGCIRTEMVLATGILPTFSAIQTDPPTCGAANGSIELAVSGGTAPYSLLLDGVLQTDFRIFNLAAGTYLLEVRDAVGCSSTEMVQLTDAGTPEISSLSVMPTTCGLDNGQLMITSAGGSPPYSFSLNGQAIQESPTFNDLPAGTYQLQLTDQAGCTLVEDFEIAASSAPQIDTLILSDAQCGLPNGGLTIEVTAGLPPYIFQLNQQVASPEPFFDQLGSGSYRVQVLDAASCLVETSFNLQDTPPLSLELLEQRAASCLDQDGQLLIEYSGGSGSLVLFENGRRLGPAEVCLQTTCQELISNRGAGNYRYLLQDSVGCVDSLTISLAAGNCPIYLPTAFSPNFDGVNDFFEPLGVRNSAIEILVFQIFDRWGGLMFEQTAGSLGDPKFRWDGRRNGQAAMVGVYSYQLKIRYTSSAEEVLSGSLQLIK